MRDREIDTEIETQKQRSTDQNRGRNIETEIERSKQRSRDKHRESAGEFHVSDSSSWSYWYRNNLVK